MLCQRITYVWKCRNLLLLSLWSLTKYFSYFFFSWVAVLCLTLHYINALEISCHVNEKNQCVFEQDVAWDGKEEFTITNSDKLAESTTDILVQAPFKTKVIPTTIFVKFPNLKSFTMMDVGLDTISNDDFVNAKKLTHLHIAKNNIVTLKAMCFSAAKNLVDLDLSDNHITKIEEGAFEGLPELTKLNLYANKVVDLDLTKFTKFPKLTYLIVAHMDFAFSAPFDSDEVAKFVALNSTITKLDLSNNPIDSTDLWRRLSIFPNLEHAYFTANKITHIDHMDEFKKLLPHLVDLVMDENPFDAKWLEEAKTFFNKAEVKFAYD